eukprot:CAMPEP_0117648694 /NCGR_PEP_ID=MMETSP0804-20121206/552_2 /TAXON_ID=1074897 /ORGANISM="Tetraselmis astigmatica, Strain CCMP880" /LENGTH=193 /DNA_ID=CAMNT_0005454335 /DNA_START=740 /DNA_END=1323 /DNA_ORIENTATION=-
MKAFGLQDSKDLCSSDPKQHSAVGQSVPPLFPGCVPPVDPPCCRPPLCLCAFLQPSNPRKAGECLQSHMLCHNHPAYRVTAAVESGVAVCIALGMQISRGEGRPETGGAHLQGHSLHGDKEEMARGGQNLRNQGQQAIDDLAAAVPASPSSVDLAACGVVGALGGGYLLFWRGNVWRIEQQNIHIALQAGEQC